METKIIKDAGKAMKVQQSQIMSAEEQMQQMKKGLGILHDLNDSNADELDDLIAQAEQLCSDSGINTDNIEKEETREGLEVAGIDDEEQETIQPFVIKKTDIVDYQEDWDKYLISINEFAKTHAIDLVQDPYATLLSQQQHDELMDRIQKDYYAHKPPFDKYDYILAAFCGVASGLIDSFFVGKPGDSKFGNFTDKATDSVVKKFAHMNGWPKDKDNIAGAIGYLEKKYHVTYDKPTANFTDDGFSMITKNHHIKSLAHSPDIVGLFFSILDQYTDTATFVSNGQMFTLKGDGTQLQGRNFIEKIFCGFSNWLGHIMSDVAGSSGTRGKVADPRGTGVPVPFSELLLFCNKGSIQIGKDRQTIAEVTTRLFQEGYDLRFGIATAIPVVINEFFIRMCWLIKQHFYHNVPWKKCIPIAISLKQGNEDSGAIVLRRMLLAGYGSMCIVDVGDAAIRSAIGPNPPGVHSLEFLLRINYVAWGVFAIRLTISGIMELRLNYDTKHLNVKKLDKDLESEWNRLYIQTSM